jgi:hypothetical protein
LLYVYLAKSIPMLNHGVHKEICYLITIHFFNQQVIRLRKLVHNGESDQTIA